jgi:hypothetical protein
MRLYSAIGEYNDQSLDAVNDEIAKSVPGCPDAAATAAAAIASAAAPLGTAEADEDDEDAEVDAVGADGVIIVDAGR